MTSGADTLGRALPPELQAALGRLSEIGSLPEITARIVQVVEDPRSTAHDMHEIIKSDPALAAKVLKVVNSAFYGLPAQISSLERAILMLGLSAVKNIALAASLARLFNADGLSEQFTARDLWRHCIAVAVCGRLLAGVAEGTPVDDAFAAGLVHDLGLLVVQQVFPAKLRLVIEQCQNSPLDFCETERSVIGADHGMFGGALAAKWKFPPELRCAIGLHHDLEAAPAQYRRMTATVQIADTVCSHGRYGFWLTAYTQQASSAALEAAGLTPEQLDDVLEALPSKVEEAEAILTE